MRYSPELRAEVVKAVLESDRNYAQVARDFDLIPETLRTWVKRAKEEQLGNSGGAGRGGPGTGGRVGTTHEESGAGKLVPKKCATFFAKESV
jgi:transposase